MAEEEDAWVHSQTFVNCSDATVTGIVLPNLWG